MAGTKTDIAKSAAKNAAIWALNIPTFGGIGALAATAGDVTYKKTVATILKDMEEQKLFNKQVNEAMEYLKIADISLQGQINKLIGDKTSPTNLRLSPASPANSANSANLSLSPASPASLSSFASPASLTSPASSTGGTAVGAILSPLAAEESLRPHATDEDESRRRPYSKDSGGGGKRKKSKRKKKNKTKRRKKTKRNKTHRNKKTKRR